MNAVANNQNLTFTEKQSSIIELKIQNHPGVMSHICGLLSRRAYNMEAIMCVPMRDKQYSRIWLLMNEEERLPQVMQQIQKLHDVIKVQQHAADHRAFLHLKKLFIQ